MAILREWMNPLNAIWYRIINDPLQIYLAITCWTKVLTGNVQIPGRSGLSSSARVNLRKRVKA
jgi:hypothetical protein